MTDTLIYLVDKYSRAMDNHSPECVDDQLFAAKLLEGYEQVSTLPTKKVKFGSKTLQVTPMILRLKGRNNALSVPRGFEDEHADFEQQEGTALSVASQGSILKRFGDFAKNIEQGITRALSRQSDGASHLGAYRDHNMPGLSIVSGELVSKAFDAGQLAKGAGISAGECPFPEGSAPATKWRQGWHANQDQEVSSEALGRISEDARQLALSLKSDPDAEVRCPFRKGSSTHAAWLEGFVAGGGRVE